MTLEWLSVGLEVAAIHIAGIFAAGHAIMNTRTSQGAIAWAVALVAVPYVTLIPYLFLGRTHFAGYVDEATFEIARRSARGLNANEPVLLSFREQHHPAMDPSLNRYRAVEKLIGQTFVAGNDVHLLKDGDATFSAILDAIATARDYILIQFFVVRSDRLGMALQAALLARAAEGVKVYFLYDGIGSHSLDRGYIEALRLGGVEIHAFSIRRFRNRFQLNFRNHRKIVVVDGRQAFVGGHNVGVEYLGEKPPLAPWRDTHVAIRGPVIGQIQRTFSEDWYWVTQQLPAVRSSMEQAGDMLCLGLASGPADAQETCSLFFVQAIHAAKRRVWLASPYFVPDSAVSAALRLAVLRGVDVRVLVPSRPDHLTVFQASLFHTYEAVHAGVRVYRYQPGFMHQKVMLIDDDTASVGSANLDNRSFRLNFELNVLTVSPAFASQVEAMLLVDFAHARQVAADEFAGLTRLRKVAMHVARLFAPIL
ncbi:cardiolipin synthase [Pigmentiphaga litoralis]|uniref:cardiolipin synthase n=1 Tax=Pigmentiphaga litoralis TaxID=516702 RepID=UPI003B42B7F8